MIGKKLYKESVTIDQYAEIAAWCNENQATIKNCETYFEVVSVPEPDFQTLKEEKLNEISDWTQNKIVGGFIYDGVTYDSDVDTQITMQGIALNVNTPLFAEKYPDGCPVRGYDEGSAEKTIHYLTPEEVLGFCAALSMHIGYCKQLGWSFQNQVAAATTEEELDAIVLPE